MSKREKRLLEALLSKRGSEPFKTNKETPLSEDSPLDEKEALRIEDEELQLQVEAEFHHRRIQEHLIQQAYSEVVPEEDTGVSEQHVEDHREVQETKASGGLSKNQKRKLKHKKRFMQLKAEGNLPKRTKKAQVITFDGIAIEDDAKAAAETEKPKEEPLDEYYRAMLEFRKISDLSSEEEAKQFYSKLLDFLRGDTNIADPSELKKLHHTSEGLENLFRMLSKRSLPKEVTRQLLSIKHKLARQEWDEADQLYFSLTIGNSTWGTKNAILNDDEKREVLQAVKRLMTYWRLKVPKFRIYEEIEEQQDN